MRSSVLLSAAVCAAGVYGTPLDLQNDKRAVETEWTFQTMTETSTTELPPATTFSTVEQAGGPAPVEATTFTLPPTTTLIQGQGQAQPTAAQQQQQQQQQADGAEKKQDKPASGSPGIIAQSPKREASDNLEPESPAKRRKEDDEVGSAVGQEQHPERETQTTQQQQSGEDGSRPEEGGQEPKRDAEGDVVLSDAADSAAPDGREDAPATNPGTEEEREAKLTDGEIEAKQDSTGPTGSPAETTGG